MPKTNDCTKRMKIKGLIPNYMEFDQSINGFTFNVCQINIFEKFMIEIYLYDKDNLFRVFPIDFDIPVPPIACPGFTKPLGLWGINMSKEINMFYTYSFPKL